MKLTFIKYEIDNLLEKLEDERYILEMQGYEDFSLVKVILKPFADTLLENDIVTNYDFIMIRREEENGLPLFNFEIDSNVLKSQIKTCLKFGGAKKFRRINFLIENNFLKIGFNKNWVTINNFI